MVSHKLKKDLYNWTINWDKEKELYQTVRGKEHQKQVVGIWQKGNEKKVNSLIEKARERGYSETGELSNEFSCMLLENIKSSKDFYPCLAEYKYDGARLFETNNGIFTKNELGKLSKKITYLNTLEKQLKCLRKILIKYLKTDNFILDGELYNHDVKFDGTLKMLKFNHDKEDIDDTWLEQKEFVDKYAQFCWFDIAIEGYDLSERIGIRNKVYKYFKKKFPSDRIYNVPNVTINNRAEADILFEKACSEGYEGIVLKDQTSYYENRRTPRMLKYKKIQDLEGTIVDIIEGKGEREGVLGRVIIEYLFNNRVIHQSIDLKSSEGVKVDRKLLREMLENKDNFIGKKLTVEYMELTKNGKMKLGKGLVSTIKAVRDYELNSIL